MKTLQNDLTTIEQSKRLLELGVPKNSANHYHGKDGKTHYIDGSIPCSLLWADELVPCWSVGRLIEIFLLCTPYKDIALNTSDLIEQMVVSLFMVNKDGLLDFSKLEE